MCLLLTALRAVSALGADTGPALNAITDTADRICGIVATQGEVSGSKIEGDVHAELSGLAKKLASLGFGGTGDISSSKYQGVLQQDLPTTLKDTRECKLRVLDKLQAVLLPLGGQQPRGPGALPASLIQSPSSAPLIDTVKSWLRQEEFGLYSCTSGPNSISCYIVFSRDAPGPNDYNIERRFLDQTKLIDNLHVEHHLRQASFIDGLGSPHKGINLSTGESVWLLLEFEGNARPISFARIVFAPSPVELRGPVSSIVQ